MERRGVYPGSFDPLTVAHVAIAEAAHDQLSLDTLDLVVSRVALAKEHTGATPLDRRLEALERAAAGRSWLHVVVTDAQLLADIAEGYDVLVVGADKWDQLLDAGFYADSEAARDAAVARLPAVAVAPRPPHPVPAGVTALRLPADLAEVSSTRVREGEQRWLAPEAQ